ncbi:predicted protein [Botrytis cinerea T4]|uniref:Uncharacterized protein n=1 Tax=Botryotinia fuckeliana (strain T4) TaxID=999810 RepID=G2XRR9_BOTF4|nr:predicted protein [Botrytis cinerea T4]
MTGRIANDKISEITSNGIKKRKLNTKYCEQDTDIIDFSNETPPLKAPGRCAASVGQAAQPVEDTQPGMESVLAELSRQHRS